MKNFEITNWENGIPLLPENFFVMFLAIQIWNLFVL